MHILVRPWNCPLPLTCNNFHGSTSCMYNYSTSSNPESTYVYCTIEILSVLFSVQSGFIAGIRLDYRLPIVICELVSVYNIERSDSKNKDIFCE